ncbi:MAG: L-threonylcarbamoyladenylate synthase [Planctomycetales bacterium]
MATCPIGTDVSRAAAVLRAGGLVAFATETVYGLGANALDPLAVARVFDVKGRPRFDPLIVHVASADALGPLVAEFPRRARELAARFWPGPLTLVLPKTDRVPDLVTAGLPTVAVRIPDHPLALELLRAAEVPVAAPSANRFGRISPTRAEHVAEQLGDRIDYILDGGPCRVGVESTVLAVPTRRVARPDQRERPTRTDETAVADSERPTLLRPGGVTVEEIEAVIGPIAAPSWEFSAEGEAAASPGMLSRHYAPRTPLAIRGAATASPNESPGARIGLLAFRPPVSTAGFAAVEVLSPTGDLREAAAEFFAAVRRLDALGLDRIVAESFPPEGLGRALNDRLRRAAK